MSFNLEELAMFIMGGVMGGAYVPAEHAVEWVLFEVLFDHIYGLMKRMKQIIVLDDGSGQEDNAPATSAKLQSGNHQRVCVEQEMK